MGSGTVLSTLRKQPVSPVSQAHGSAPLHSNTDIQSIKPYCFLHVRTGTETCVGFLHTIISTELRKH